MKITLKEPNSGLLYNLIKKFLPQIATPVIKELPFICLFMLLMDVSHILGRIYLRILDLHQNAASPGYIELLGGIVILFLFAYIGATIITVVKNKKVKWGLKSLFYLLAISLYAIRHFLEHNFDLDINPTCFVLLAETTSNESQEFINQYILSSTILPTLKRVAIYVVMILLSEYFWCYVNIWLRKWEYVVKSILSIILIPIFLFGLYNTNVYWRVYNVQNPDEVYYIAFLDDPISSIYKSLITLRIMKETMEDAIELNTAIYKNETSYNTQTDTTNIVVVIGESYIKVHSQLYGYNLKTTPNLVREQNEGRLFTFNDVVSSSNLTSVIMRNILCCNNSSNDEQWYDYPNFLTIFKKSGYDVYFWDNQKDVAKTATFSFTINSFLYDSKMCEISYTQINDKSYQYDEEIVKSYKEDVVLKNKCNLVLFHLMGQHSAAIERFPHDKFTYFTVDSIKREASYLGDTERKQIADYDNATLYNDYVMNEIFDTFRNSNTILIYFSDHGEEVYDYRKVCGRDHGDLTADKLKYQYDIPFMIWCSDIYKKNNPEVVANIKEAINRPFIIDNICNMLFNVAKIKTPYYRDSLDLLSPNYKCKERIIKGCVYENIRYSNEDK